MDVPLATPRLSEPHLPDYAGGSIVNLMASIASGLGAKDWRYPALRESANVAQALSRRSRVVLLVVDGLGYGYLTSTPAAATLKHFLHGSLTSVFPSTTATAITTFLTGQPPAQHGLTGWHLWFPELATTGAVLPLRRRATDQPLSALGLSPAVLFGDPTFFESLPVQSFAVGPERIVDSEFNRAHTRGAQRRSYGGVEDFFASTLSCLRSTQERCYVYGYYADFDSIAHEHGVASRPAEQLLKRFDDAFRTFIAAARGLDATILVCADHGFIDSPRERAIELDRHPRLEACLRLPLCGERRAAYCYVRPGMARAFEDYIQQELQDKAWLYPSIALIEKGWFGSIHHGAHLHPKLKERIGDYTLVMKENWTIKDWLPGERRYRQIGVHGGVTPDEMIVPLVVAQP